MDNLTAGIGLLHSLARGLTLASLIGVFYYLTVFVNNLWHYLEYGW